jgi:transposase
MRDVKRIDAAVLANMGATMSLAIWPPGSDTLNDLRELRVGREALVRERTATKNRYKTLTIALLSSTVQHRSDSQAQGVPRCQKLGKSAITALMRKLIVLANTRLRGDRTWAAQTN